MNSTTTTTLLSPPMHLTPASEDVRLRSGLAREGYANDATEQTRTSAGSSPTARAGSRPGSADIRPELVAAHQSNWNLPGQRSTDQVNQQLPGIYSILNEQSGDNRQTHAQWQNGPSYSTGHPSQGGYSHSSQSHARNASDALSHSTAFSGNPPPDARNQPMHFAPQYAPYAAESGYRSAYNEPQPNHEGSLVPNLKRESAAQSDSSMRKTMDSSTMSHYGGMNQGIGQGPSFVYSDKSVVDGKPAKKEWGVTKLGNPRKRQAEACIACRTKKIKCERVGSSNRVCAHCMKQKIDCRWARSSGTSPEPNEESRLGEGSMDEEEKIGSAYGSRVSQSPRISHTPPAKALSNHMDALPPDDSESRLMKRPRLSTQSSDPAFLWAYTPGQGERHMTVAGQRVTAFEPAADPFLVCPEVSSRLLELFFDYRNEQTGAVLPRRQFTRWCLEFKNKSTADRMVCYAIMALGSVFSTTPDLKGVSQHLADIARSLEHREFSRFSLQLAQTRLYLSLYHWAKGYANHSFEYTESACRVLSALSYNTEEGCRGNISSTGPENEFGLTPTELIECRRRTFWMGYMTERSNGYCSGHLGLLSDRDIWTALPNRESDFEAGFAFQGPSFANGDYDRSVPLGLQATFVGIGSIWGEITSNIYRTIYSSPNDYAARHSDFYDRMESRLYKWNSNLPHHLQLTPANTRQNLKDDCFLPYYVIHGCHLIAGMKLNRYARHALLPPEIVRRNLRRARHYARLLLEIVSAIAKSEAFAAPRRSRDLDSAISQPFTAYAVLAACDIVSSRGSTSALSDAQSHLGQAKTVVSECARFFNSAKQQRIMIDSRLSELGAHVAMKFSNVPTWRFAEPIEPCFIPREMDLFYSVDDALYFGALEEGEAGVYSPIVA